MTDDEPRAPSAGEMIAILVIAPLVSAAVFGLLTRSQQATTVAVIASAAAALMLGWPLLFWAFDHGKTRLAHLLWMGIILGAVPLMAALASGMAGLYMRSTSTSYVREVLGRGVPMPFYGHMGWPRFAVLEGNTREPR